MNICSSRLLTLLFSYALLLATGYSCQLQAQDLDNITVSGRVLDQNHKAVSGATITIILKQTGATRSTISSGEGRYRLIQLRPGTYSLLVAAGGFSPHEKS